MIRNFVASVIFGLAPVRRMMANVLSEVAVGYPDSPLNSSHDFEHHAPKPGSRAPVHGGEPAVGLGPAPRFALFAEENHAFASVAKEFADILEPKLREPHDASGF